MLDSDLAFEAQVSCEEQQRDTLFDPWRCAATPAAQAFTAAILARLTAVEVRQFARQPAEVATWQATVDALAAGLALVSLDETETAEVEPRALAVPMRHGTTMRSRYERREVTPKSVRVLVQLMGLAGLARVTPGSAKAHRSATLRATSQFMDLLGVHSITRNSFGRQGGETIVLRSPKGPRGQPGVDVEYRDDRETRAMRAEVEAVNAYINSAAINAAGEGSEVALGDRWVRRIFDQRADAANFTRGGRLCGGEWQRMPSEDRLISLRIAGQPVAVVNWQACYLIMAFAAGGVAPRDGDLYAVAGYPRQAVKRAISARLADEGPRYQFPKGLNEAFPRGTRWADVEAGILHAHPALASTFGTGFAHRAARLESNALMLVLRDLAERGIVALPIFDAVAVPVPHAATARLSMEAAFHKVVGVSGRVSIRLPPDSRERPQP